MDRWLLVIVATDKTKKNMEIIILKDSESVAKAGATIIQDLVDLKPSATLGLATGSTPVAMYEQLALLHKSQGLSFQTVKTFNLDEYLGLESESPQSYRTFMNQNLFDRIDIPLENTYLPSCKSERDIDKDSANFEARIKMVGGIDLQVLGIGTNGHIGFNEPTSSLSSRTRVKTLTMETLDANRRFFKEGEFQPSLAITMGIGTILDARRLLLMATGSSKALAVRNAIEGSLSAMCPASALQLHPKVTVIVDEAAASELAHGKYYRWVNVKKNELLDKNYEE